MAIDRTAFNALVDDDGSNTVGSVWNKAAIKNVLLDPIDVALGAGIVVQSTTLTGTQHNFALTPACSVLRCINSAPLTLTGFTAGVNGQVLQVTSYSSQVDFLHQNAGSSAGNRLQNFVTGTAPTSLGAGVGNARYAYDGVAGYWRLLTHEQGIFIPVPFSAANFSALGGGTWTVTGGQVSFNAYFLRAKSVVWSLTLTGTTYGGTAQPILVMVPPVAPIFVLSGVVVPYCLNNGTRQANTEVYPDGTARFIGVNATNFAAGSVDLAFTTTYFLT